MNNNLINDLRNYIMNAISENKDVDSNIITDITDIIINYYKLEYYVRNINVIKGQFNSCFYHNGDKQITIYTSTLRNDVENLSTVLQLSPSEKVYFLYCRLLIIILHEIEHANQEKITYSFNKDLESLIIKTSNSFFAPCILSKGCSLKDIKKQCAKVETKEFNKQNYDISPLERLANLKSLTTTNKVFNNDSIPLSKIKKYFTSILLSTYLKGYDKYPAPTITYIQRFNPFADLKKILSKSQDLSLKECLTYGLELSNGSFSINEILNDDSEKTTDEKVLTK